MLSDNLKKKKNDSFCSSWIFALIFFFLAMPCGMQDLSSPKRDLLNQNPYSGSVESQLLGPQGSPPDGWLYIVKQSTIYIEQIYF